MIQLFKLLDVVGVVLPVLFTAHLTFLFFTAAHLTFCWKEKVSFLVLER